jgi:FlaA1/EpsC-like NDP-sugar epimerase
VTVVNNTGAALVLSVVGAASFIGIGQLKYREMAVFQNGVLLPLYDRPIMGESSQVFFDLGFIISAYAGSLAIVRYLHGGPELGIRSLSIISIIAGIQLLVFWLSGTYRNTYRYLGLSEALALTKSVLLAAAATGGFLAVLNHPESPFDIVLLLLDFYFLFTLVIGHRVAFRILKHLYNPETTNERKVLIYGADPSGVLMQEQLLEKKFPQSTLVGFLDENPTLEGKYLNGYPIFGGHWRLERLLKSKKIDEIILCCDDIKPESIRRLKTTAAHHNILVKRMQVLFPELDTTKPQ